MHDSALPDIQVAAVAIVRDRRVLMVTARGRDVIYMPGGKIDAGESAAEAAIREAREELGVDVDPASVAPLFTVVQQAHGEPEGRMVRMHVFAAHPLSEPAPTSEVDALHWVTTADLDRCPPAGRDTLRRLAASGAID